MNETVDLAVIVGVFVALIGIGIGLLVDPLRPRTSITAGLSITLIGFLVGGLAPRAVLSVPVLVTAFALTAFISDRLWRAALTRERSAPRTPPPPAPSTSATG
ncbi:hypothetical protein QE392_000730 [Microbacterium proteolyticum]|nr:hypothetical protein [Microbacterium sp. SORGH_AS_0344]MDQ1168926.1 hypothetical protein [Microbacterium proteolyticum]